MDLQENYIVSSHGGASNSFVSNFAYPIRVQSGHKIALKSIYYGPRMNVTDKNNRLWLKVGEDSSQYAIIKNGWYSSTYELFEAIVKGVNVWVDEYNEANHTEFKYCTMKFITDANFNDVQLKFDGDNYEAIHTIKKDKIKKDDTEEEEEEEEEEEDIKSKINVLHLLQFKAGEFIEITAANLFYSSHYPGFLYANVVEDSYFDNKPSRLLAIIPMQSGYSDVSTGYHFYESASPTYYNFGIRQFSNIIFTLLDKNGDLIDFDPNFETIIVIEVFKPLNISL